MGPPPLHGVADLADAADEDLGPGGGEGRAGVGEGVDAGAPEVRALREGPADDLVDVGGEVAAHAGDGEGLFVRDGEHDLGHVAGEGRARRQEVVEDGAERPDVGADVDALRLAHQLGRRVGREAEGRGGGEVARGGGDVAHELGGAEVDDLDLLAAEALREEEVRRLELAEEDVVGVGLGDGLGGLEDVEDGLRQGERAALLEVAREVLPFEVLAGEVEGAVGGGADVEDAGGVLGLEPGERLRLAAEALDLAGVDELRREDADGQALVEVGVEGVEQEPARPAHDRADSVLPCEDVTRFDRVGPHAWAQGKLGRARERAGRRRHCPICGRRGGSLRTRRRRGLAPARRSGRPGRPRRPPRRGGRGRGGGPRGTPRPPPRRARPARSGRRT